jgi:hypothetical protein
MDGVVVPGARIELATPAFSGRRSTTELPRLFNHLQTVDIHGICSGVYLWSERNSKFSYDLRILQIIAAESLDRNEFVLGREMRVSHGHLNILVSHEFRDRTDIHVGHHQTRRECVTQIMPREVHQNGFPRCSAR